MSKFNDYTIEHADDFDFTPKLTYTFSAEKFLTPARNLRIIPALDQIKLDHNAIGKQKREFPLDFNGVNEKTAKIIIHLPKNLKVKHLPESRIMENETITYDAVAQLYRRLRRNYENNYRFAEAGGFFIGEMEMRRLDVTARFKNKYIRKIELWLKRNFSLIGIYKHLSLYGESYIRPVVWGLIVIILYPLVMHWLFNPTLTIQPIDFLNTNVRNSLASFFQMDNTYIMERIIGIPILGLLFIALKRNFERKR